jgi:hypothetical protein
MKDNNFNILHFIIFTLLLMSIFIITSIYFIIMFYTIIQQNKVVLILLIIAFSICLIAYGFILFNSYISYKNIKKEYSYISNL